MYDVICLSEQLSEKRIIIHSASDTRESIIREMVYLLSDELGSELCADVYEEVMKREKVKSTGIGQGLAVPHARTNLVKQLYCAAATSKNGINFQTFDGKPANLFLLVVSPDFTVGPHLNILSTISRLVGKNAKIISELNEAESPETFLEILKEEEEKYTI
jgi:mannitol/fructose-specific phosphotransferase system IIA component (Ntr-type)